MASAAREVAGAEGQKQAGYPGQEVSRGVHEECKAFLSIIMGWTVRYILMDYVDVLSHERSPAPNEAETHLSQRKQESKM